MGPLRQAGLAFTLIAQRILDGKAEAVVKIPVPPALLNFLDDDARQRLMGGKDHLEVRIGLEWVK